MGVEVKGLPKSGAIPSHLSKFESDEYVNFGGLKKPDLEKIYEMNPGLIIISGRQADYYEELSKIAPTLYMGLDSEDYLASFEKNMKVLADIFDKTDIVEKGLAEVNEKIEDLNKKVSEQGLNALVYAILQAPIQSLGATPFTPMILIFMAMILWSVGIHGTFTVSPIYITLYASMNIANISYAAQAGTKIGRAHV